LFIAKDVNALTGIFGLLPGSSTISPSDDQKTSSVRVFLDMCVYVLFCFCRDY